MAPFIQKLLYQSGFQIHYLISIVGLPNKAVSEARDRVRSALASMSNALPSKRITVNLSPEDLPKDGSHFDLPIALALLAAIGIIAQDACENTVSLGELSLDGALVPVRGALPAAITAAASDRLLICPTACGPKAAWVENAQVIGADSLWNIIQHLTVKNRSLLQRRATLRPR